VDSECEQDEKPGRVIFVPAFRIDRTEVSVDAFARCVSAGKCSSKGLEMPFSSGKEQAQYAEFCNWAKPGRGGHPVNCVDWTQAVAYCRFAGKRLPTDPEWEKAARGPDKRKYAWGNDGFQVKLVANIADEAARRRSKEWTWAAPGYDDGFPGTAPVGSFPLGASPFGALDMIGNVWEWTQEGNKDGDSHSLRGGSWNVATKVARVSFNNWDAVNSRLISAGFRCAE
jgi:formylglycine-generating enzyme required for sulfatase activity